MTGFGHSEILKVVARSPVTTVDELRCGAGEILDPVDIT